MSRVLAPPFLLPPATAIGAEDWTLRTRQGWEELPESVVEWDYATELQFQRHVRVDVRRVLSACRLSEDSALAISVFWHSTGTGRRGCLCRTEVCGGETLVNGVLAGKELGGHLRLVTRLVLAGDTRQMHPLSPRRGGSILWEDQAGTNLEGEAPMFPIEVVDFSSAGLPPYAAWHLDWGRDTLDSATLGSVRLYLNRAHPALNLMLGREDEGQGALLASALGWDLLRQMVEHALDHDDMEESDYPAESLGAALIGALGTAFPGQAIGSVRSLRTTNPSDFESTIQSAARLFGL